MKNHLFFRLGTSFWSCLVFIGIFLTEIHLSRHSTDNGTGPLSPQEELKTFKVAPEFKVELVASEPLIQEPTGVCWDEQGDLYVSELHGYNLEGQLEIEALNQTGVIDTAVRRIQAAEEFKKSAEKGTYGTIKKLIDTNGDGQMDKAIIFADHIAPAYGLCAALGGIIVAGHAEIIFLADRDLDGRAEIIDTLYKGFQRGALERGLNAPQWGPDGWIYVGRGWNGGTIVGPKLARPVQLPGSNFRIRADGTAIEPVTGSTHTIGHALSPDGYSLFCTTWKHALYAAPIPWHYLSRNPDAAIGSLEADASDYSIVYPIAPVHPWKLARSNQAEWRQYYDRYGLAESAAGGYFTSSCSPLIYQDQLFSQEYWGSLFVCEPAQCLVHRCNILEDGTALKVSRATNELEREFLASSDSWFRPVSLSSAPDGSLYVTDMYREIIEDYSAVPRFMQQKYGLKNGVDMGRIWRISPVSAPTLVKASKPILNSTNWDKYLDSPHYWYRQTADRLIREHHGNNAPALVQRMLSINKLTPVTTPSLFIQALRAQDTLLRNNHKLARILAGMTKEISNERVLLQLALSLGYSTDSPSFNSLLYLARQHANIRWMTDAILSSIHHRESAFLMALLSDTGKNGHLFFEPLAATIAARGDEEELNSLLDKVSKHNENPHLIAVLRGLSKNLQPFSLNSKGESALNKLLRLGNLALQGQAISLANKLKRSDNKMLESLFQKAMNEVTNTQLSSDQRLAAVALLSDAPDALAGPGLVNAWESATPHLRSAILDALISRGQRLEYLLKAFEQGKIAHHALLPIHRTQLLERADGNLRPRLETAFSAVDNPDKEAIFNRFAVALNQKEDLEKGRMLFQQLCSPCHRVGKTGLSVGPDLKNSFSNSNETILRNILFPSEKIASGYDIYMITTNDGQVHSGILVSESANNVVLRQAGGNEQSFLRKNIKNLSSSASSLMPAYDQVLTPGDCASIIRWMKTTLENKGEN
jgi:putative membrane-bound dehydrogenase-like protein